MNICDKSCENNSRHKCHSVLFVFDALPNDHEGLRNLKTFSGKFGIEKVLTYQEGINDKNSSLPIWSPCSGVAQIFLKTTSGVSK